MPTNHMVFRTEGDWDSTTLFNNENEVLATRLLVELHAGRGDDGQPVRGGVAVGGEMTAYVCPQEDPERQDPIFPGRLEAHFPGHSLVIENRHPEFLLEATRVWHNDREVTEGVVDLVVDINAEEDVARAYITLYRPRWVGADEVATYNIL